MSYNPNDPKHTSWIAIPKDSDFPIQNIPFGIYSSECNAHRAASRIGDFVIDLKYLHDVGFFAAIELPENIFSHPVLNPFMALGKEVTNAVRVKLSQLFHSDNKSQESVLQKALKPIENVEMHLPVQIGDYTDFYSSIEHATNVGVMFRGKENALMPNWKHLPVGYHGRSSSIVVSGTNIHRPKGQTLPKGADKPIYGPSKLMDFELEMAFVTGKSTRLGNSVTTTEAEDYIFGLLLFNDLSARDIQKWEYVPLGPFLGKNFGSVVSPWMVTLEALEPFRIAGPKQEPEVLDYLKYKGAKNYDIQLEVALQPEANVETTICRSNFKYMYWNMAQQLAHQTVNGCNVNVGDLYASGTLSGPTEDSYGSMLELSWSGQKEIPLLDGSTRKFMQDNDTIIVRGFAEKDGVRIGFGEAKTKLLPAL